MRSSRRHARTLAATLLAALAAAMLVTSARAEPRADPPYGPVVSALITATWTCQDQLGVPHTPARSPWARHSKAYWVHEKNLWTHRYQDCLARLHVRATALHTGDYTILPDSELYALADESIAHGGIYSIAWGDASPILKGLCYEAVRRAFHPYGTEQWARYVVNRESGCNPGAVNTTYSSWSQRATGIAQLIPAVHTWVDYRRFTRDLRYAIDVFLRLSHGGRSTGPWAY